MNILEIRFYFGCDAVHFEDEREREHVAEEDSYHPAGSADSVRDQCRSRETILALGGAWYHRK